VSDDDIGEAIAEACALDEDIGEAIVDEDIDMEVESESDMGDLSDDGGLDARAQAQLEADAKHRFVDGLFN